MAMKKNEEMVKNLVSEGWLKSKNIIEAFLKIKREDFVLEDFKDISYSNEALPIGFGQTISQPLVVAFMLELLSPQKGEKILDIGSGSGWTSALLAECVGEQGKVIGIEIVPEIFEFGKNNLKKYNFIEKGIVQFILGDGILGFAKEAPFDKILCSASLQEEVPKAWKEQLKIKGKIVVPLFHSIWLFEKIANDQFKESEFEGFVFVPFVKKK